MFNIGNVKLPLCSGLSRRSFLQVGTTAMGSMSLTAMNALKAAGAVKPNAKIKNCITLFLVGSPGHVDTFDMKPEAPEDIRGHFKPIDTNVSGVQICEHFPKIGRAHV